LLKKRLHERKALVKFATIHSQRDGLVFYKPSCDARQKCGITEFFYVLGRGNINVHLTPLLIKVIRRKFPRGDFESYWESWMFLISRINL
jgi:hypothetical protein